MRSLFVRPHPNPIFLLGNQRSGTSAIAILLARMTGLRVAKDLVREYTSSESSYPRLRSGELSFAEFVHRNRLSFSREIVKDPQLTVFHEELAAHFPDSRMVYIVRDPRDNIRSILNRLDLPGDVRTLDPEDLERIKPGWRLLVDGSWLGLTGKTVIEMLAQRWNSLVEVYLRNEETMVLIRYEDFLLDKVGFLRSLANRLDLEMIHDVSALVDVQYQPRGDREVPLTEFFGEENLSRIETICGERMTRFAYETS